MRGAAWYCVPGVGATTGGVAGVGVGVGTGALVGIIFGFSILTALLKWVLIGKYRPSETPLWSSFVWRNELVNSLCESYVYPFWVTPLLGTPFATTRTGRVGDQLVPMPHFGLVLALDDWQSLARRLEAASVEFIMAPQIRYPGDAGEQWTMFLCDPSGNPIEIKGFRDPHGIYAL